MPNVPKTKLIMLNLEYISSKPKFINKYTPKSSIVKDIKTIIIISSFIKLMIFLKKLFINITHYYTLYYNYSIKGIEKFNFKKSLKILGDITIYYINNHI